MQWLIKIFLGRSLWLSEGDSGSQNNGPKRCLHSNL
jgi:hypothetical protein